MEQPGYFTFGIQTGTPPSLYSKLTLPRTDEVNAIITLLNDVRTHTVLITGVAGVGKSTLAALVFDHFQKQARAGLTSFQRYIWLRLGPRTTWPDIITALSNGLQAPLPNSRPISQRSNLQTFYEILRQPEQKALIVLDQCEELFDKAIESHNHATPYTIGLGLSSAVRFLEMLQENLGTSRILLTCSKSPYGSNYEGTPGVREYIVGGLTIVDGISLLQQRNILGRQQDLSAVWQRCSGHVFALILLSAWKNLSGLSLHYLLNAPLYQTLWEEDIPHNLVEVVIRSLNPVQLSLVRALCLFREPIPLAAISALIHGERNSPEPDERVLEQELAYLIRLDLVEQINRSTGERHYILHGMLNHYLLEHYLENEPRRNNGYFSSALGVANQPRSLGEDQEAAQIALAAGQMLVADYYSRVAQQSLPPREQRSNPNELTPLLAMLEHLCLGWHWQAAYEQLTTLGLDEDLLRWGIWHTLIKLYEMMLPPIGSLKRRDEGLVYSALGMIYGRIGEYEQSRTYYTSALATQQEIADHRNKAITLVNQGEFLRILGEGEQARQNFEQALSLLQSEVDPRLACVLMHNIGLLSQQQGNVQQSLQAFLHAWQLAKQVQDTEKEGIILTNLGLLLCEQRQFAEGLALLLPALQMRHALQDAYIHTLVAFLHKLEQKMGNETFAKLSQAALVKGRQEQVLQSISNSF